MISLRAVAHVAIDDGVGIVDDRAVPGSSRSGRRLRTRSSDVRCSVKSPPRRLE